MSAEPQKIFPGLHLFVVFHSVGRWTYNEALLSYVNVRHILAVKMGDLDDYDFSTGDAGASNVYNMEAGQIRVGGWGKLRQKVSFKYLVILLSLLRHSQPHPLTHLNTYHMLNRYICMKEHPCKVSPVDCLSIFSAQFKYKTHLNNSYN